MDISIKDDIKQVRKELTRIQRKQIPFATSQAINDVAFSSQKALKVQAQQKLDRPTPFTLRGFRVRKATKNKLYGQVYINPIVARYLIHQIKGGTAPKAAVPVNIRLNKYGNIPNRRKGIIKKPEQFVDTIQGVYGIWERGSISNKGNFSTKGKARKSSLRLLAVLDQPVSYDKKFPYFKIVNGIVKNKFRKQIDIRLKRAFATAR